MSKLLFISGHPDFTQSFANKQIWSALQHRFPQADFIRLDERYPDFQIDVEQEQRQLTQADVVVLQFPFYWYGIPALMKQWIEQVFIHNFAYGKQGDKLKGKKLVLSFTLGGTLEMYAENGEEFYPVDAFLPPLIALSRLCQMDYAGAVYTGGFSYGLDNDLAQKQCDDHVNRLIAHLEQI